MKRAATVGTRALAEPTALRPLVEKITGALVKVYHTRRVSFEINIAADLRLRADAGDLYELVGNLLDNACKYGRRDGAPGKVELVVTRERRRICFAVRDHGPGIPRGEQNTIFLPFHKSAREAAHTAPGVGLGLALCRRLAAELHGTLEMDRTWKHGASFVLRLPV